MNRRLPTTLADYLIVAISPFLIMLLVGSVSFFLVEVFYRGQYELRLSFVMAMFVMGAVSVARISIEEGRAYAAMFALPLGIACVYAVSTFAAFRGPLASMGPIFVIVLLGIIWLSADKLVWNCTLLDDRRDASGKGLLSSLRDLRSRLFSVTAKPEVSQPSSVTATSENKPPPDLNWIGNWFSRTRSRSAEQPGVWVIYYSLFALPLFAIGQLAIPASDTVSRQSVFKLMVIYVTSALMLLLATSLLSIRKYLRDRNVEMPAEMALVWTVSGTILATVVVLIAMLLPRPAPEYSLAQYVEQFDSPPREASAAGAGSEGAKSKKVTDQRSATKGDDSPDTQQSSSDSEAKTPSQEQGGKGESKSSSQGGSEKSGGDTKSPSNPQPAEKTEQPSGESSENHTPSEASRSKNQSDPTPKESSSDSTSEPSPPSSSSWKPPQLSFSGVVQWLVYAFYALVAIAAGVVAYQYREQIVAAWNRFLQELKNWLAGLQRKRSADGMTTHQAEPERPKSFGEYRNPFLSGAARSWSQADLLRYTLEALEAWGREHGAPRDPSQTTLEFTQMLAQVSPTLGGLLRQFADLYGQTAFAPASSSQASTAVVEKLWQTLASTSGSTSTRG